MTTTDHDMRNQVIASIEGSGESAEGYDVHAIVDEIQATHGTVAIDSIEDNDYFWGVVERHANA
jgi:hypothetical protein